MVNCRKRQRGGAIRMPSEYFGVDSGRYTDNANAGLCPNAYGDTHAQSFGMPLNEQSVGPNMHVHPNATGMQTGGAKRRRRTKRSTKRRSTKRRSTKRTKQIKKGGALKKRKTNQRKRSYKRRNKRKN